LHTSEYTSIVAKYEEGHCTAEGHEPVEIPALHIGQCSWETHAGYCMDTDDIEWKQEEV